ncbi:uncharacterized protein B0P05DRAFT_550857 [Gilbertella persicaria]|uniref:uncharacterized protein n=1 Tax=Gilbertella persicaria TaxID=101096 RepID=UPI00221F5220|nr:uncharacterized protein B0P05DRAFT_550857 [Gilbertella persicaria]KAI8069783.1 hypothetical protein B0P05DRAFT_550857 [Gilbertella persicaria]
MDKVAKTCCTASHPGTASVNGMAGDEIDGILSGLGQLAPEIISTLSSVAGKRTQLDELPLLKPLIAADVQKLYKSIDSLNLCILQSVPASRHAIASHLTNQMHAGFLNIMTTFDI